MAGLPAGWRFTSCSIFLVAIAVAARGPSVLYASGFRYVPLVRMTLPVLKQYRMTRDACSHGKIWFICKLLPPANFELTGFPFERLGIFHLQAVARLTSKSGFFLLQNTQFILSRVKPVAAKVNVYFMNSRDAFLCPL